jgi:putative Holliday junction resolvase
LPVHTYHSQLKAILTQEKIDTIIIGHPITMKGKRSSQTIAIEDFTHHIKELFPTYTIISWDERLSSQRAQAIKPARTKEEKIHSHAVAAAFILQTYLDHLAIYKNDPS